MKIKRPKRFVYSSVDYKAGELFCHAQSCIWLLGRSDLAQVLLDNKDPHSDLGALVLGVSYEEFDRRKKETAFKNMRQASKPFNFGRPAGMGPSKVVISQRKQGPDTPSINGPSMIDDGKGKGTKEPGYKGLRFCILAGNERCGVRKVTKWGRSENTIVPTCVDCLEAADRLNKFWLTKWWENKAYFDFMGPTIEEGQLITEEALDRWTHWRDIFRAGTHLAPGEIASHFTGRIRGGLNFTQGCNTYFQSLLAEATKRAYWRITRECYDKTVVIPLQKYENSRLSAYANGSSPLLGSTASGYLHDEVLSTHAEDMGHDCSHRVSEIMCEELMYLCPDVASAVEADPTLMYCWQKEASPVWVLNGVNVPKKVPGALLIPWTRNET